MNIRFTMFPYEEQLLPIYERLLACEERAGAKVLRSLLRLGDGTKLPHWFDVMPRQSFPSSRGKTIRLSMLRPTKEPDLAHIHELLMPLGNPERVVVIKQHLLRLQNPSAIQTTTVKPTTSSSLAPLATSSDLVVGNLPASSGEVSSGGTGDDVNRKSVALKGASNRYR